MKREDPEDSVINIIEVQDIDGIIEKIKKNGGAITVEKHEVPEVGYAAYFTDPEGNKFGLMEYNPD